MDLGSKGSIELLISLAVFALTILYILNMSGGSMTTALFGIVSSAWNHFHSGLESALSHINIGELI